MSDTQLHDPIPAPRATSTGLTRTGPITRGRRLFWAATAALSVSATAIGAMVGAYIGAGTP